MFSQTLRGKLLLQLTEIREDFASGLISIFSLLPQRLRNDPLESLWYFGGKWRRFIFQDCCAYILSSLADERKVISQHFVKHYAQTPDVCAHINYQPARLLRRHVTHSAKHYSLIGINEWFGRRFRVRCGCFCQLGDAEVEHLHVIFTVQGIVLLEHHNVFRLDVSMHYALGMCRR